MRKSLNTITLLLILGLFSMVASAQTCIELGGTNSFSHTQNFDVLGAVNSPAATDTANLIELNPTDPRRWLGKWDNAIVSPTVTIDMPGWAVVEEGSSIPGVTGRVAADDGNSVGPNTYSFGNSPDRSFGSINAGSIPFNWMGGCFTNSGTVAITDVLIGFTGEQWRRGNSPVADTLQFQYSFDATNLYSGTFVDFNALDFSAPSLVGPVGARDGNAPEFRTVFPLTSLNLSVPPGGTLYIRWMDEDVVGFDDDGLAIDDVTISFLPPSAAPTQISGRVLDADGQGIFRARIEVDDLNGNKRSVATNQFGSFRLTGVSAGQAYAISVTAKGHVFKESTRVVTVNESLNNFDFVAVQ